jgi:hypothetical protein
MALPILPYSIPAPPLVVVVVTMFLALVASLFALVRARTSEPLVLEPRSPPPHVMAATVLLLFVLPVASNLVPSMHWLASYATLVAAVSMLAHAIEAALVFHWCGASERLSPARARWAASAFLWGVNVSLPLFRKRAELLRAAGAAGAGAGAEDDEAPAEDNDGGEGDSEDTDTESEEEAEKKAAAEAAQRRIEQRRIDLARRKVSPTSSSLRFPRSLSINAKGLDKDSWKNDPRYSAGHKLADRLSKNRR